MREIINYIFAAVEEAQLDFLKNTDGRKASQNNEVNLFRSVFNFGFLRGFQTEEISEAVKC